MNQGRMAKMRISPELKKLIEKYRCVKDTEGMSPAKVYKLVGENENLYLKMTDSRYKGTTYDVEREKDMMLWLEGKLPVQRSCTLNGMMAGAICS